MWAVIRQTCVLEKLRWIASIKNGIPGMNAANHGVAPMCEQFDMKDVNSAVEHVRSGKVRYRAILAH